MLELRLRARSTGMHNRLDDDAKPLNKDSNATDFKFGV
jgi:hypothetical protein